MSETDVLLAEYHRDPEAGFARIIERFESPLVRHARAVLLDTEEARDVVQEAFLRFLTDRPAVSNLGGWLYRVSRNLALDRLRKEKRHMRLREANPRFLRAGGGSGGSPESVVQARADLSRAYAILTGEQREIVFLKVQEGFSYREIGDLIDRPAGTVGWLLHEALKRMAEELRAPGQSSHRAGARPGQRPERPAAVAERESLAAPLVAPFLPRLAR
jgi:RNA polymerase sigma-70 factor (ECF subfamily)